MMVLPDRIERSTPPFPNDRCVVTVASAGYRRSSRIAVHRTVASVPLHELRLLPRGRRIHGLGLARRRAWSVGWITGDLFFASREPETSKCNDSQYPVHGDSLGSLEPATRRRRSADARRGAAMQDRRRGLFFTRTAAGRRGADDHPQRADPIRVAGRATRQSSLSSSLAILR